MAAIHCKAWHMKAIVVFTLCSVILASLPTCCARIPARLRHRGRAKATPAWGRFSNTKWETCPAKQKKEPTSLPGRKVATLENKKEELDRSMTNLIAAAKEINEIMRSNLGESRKNAPIVITAFVGCPDGSGGSMVEILQELDSGETATAAFPSFLRIDGIGGDDSDDGGGGGSSGGCYDEELGLCCEGPCPC